MTHDEWVQRALDARVEQLGHLAVEDPVALDIVASALSSSAVSSPPLPSEIHPPKAQSA